MPFEITCGVRRTALRVVVYGPEGIGKSSLAAQFPDPVFVDVEGGTNQLPVARLPRPSSWTMLQQEVEAVRAGEVGCSTLVIDTADAAEALCTRDLLARNGKGGIEDFGYGKGYTYLAESFGGFLDQLGLVVDGGVNVVVVSHAIMRKFERPDESGAYDRFELKLSKKVAPMVKEWADMVLFCDYKTYVTVDKSGKAKASGGTRVIRTTHAPQWDAKNRFNLPDELPLEWDSIAAVVPDMRAGEADGPDHGPGARVDEDEPEPAGQGPRPEARPKTKPKPKPKPKTTADAAGDPRDSYPARMRALTDLMRRDGVTDAELRKVVAHSGNFPESCPATDYEQGFVDYLVAGWDTILARVSTIRIEEEKAMVHEPLEVGE